MIFRWIDIDGCVQITPSAKYGMKRTENRNESILLIGNAVGFVFHSVACHTVGNSCFTRLTCVAILYFMCRRLECRHILLTILHTRSVDCWNSIYIIFASIFFFLFSFLLGGKSKISLIKWAIFCGGRECEWVPFKLDNAISNVNSRKSKNIWKCIKLITFFESNRFGIFVC